MSRLKLFADLSGSLTDDFDQPDQRKYQLSIFVQVAALLTLNKGKRLLCRIKHMAQADGILTLRHTEPRRF